MTIHWQQIAECLRAELADYGGVLHLLETQQRSLFEHDANAVLRYAGEIEALNRTANGSREQREQKVAAFAIEHGQAATATLRSLLPLIEVSARPLLEALIVEVHLLIHRVRRASRHNHTLLARAVDANSEPRLQAGAQNAVPTRPFQIAG